MQLQMLTFGSCASQGMLPGVLRGLNATVFAYGATGSGKTHTMVGDASDPGLMVLSMNDVFEHMVCSLHIARLHAPCSN